MGKTTGKTAAACLFAPALMALHFWASPSLAGGADPGVRTEAACAAVRDRQLDTLEREAGSVAVAFDADIAVAESPEYELLKAKEALLRDIADEKRAALDRYRRCATGGPAGR